MNHSDFTLATRFLLKGCARDCVEQYVRGLEELPANDDMRKMPRGEPVLFLLSVVW